MSPRPSRSRPAPQLAGALLALSLLGGPATVAAGTVALLQSAPLAPYAQAAASFSAAHTGPVRTFMLEAADPAQLLRDIESAHPDVIVAVGLKAALFARDRLPRLPLVFCVVPNFERFDLRGATVSGVSADVPPDRELAALRAAAPEVRSVGMLYGRDTGADLARRARAAARAAGIIWVGVPVSGPADLKKAAGELVERVDALWFPADPTVATPEAFHSLLELSLEKHKPLLAFSESLVRSGALVAVSPDYAWMGAQAAEVVRRVQNGERAGDIGVVPLRRTHVVLNPATARALGRGLPAASGVDIEVLP
jgi:putative ABC transport system substrate-binding protein